MAYSPKTKAEVLAAVVGEGMTYEDAEAKWGVPKGTISKWIKSVAEKGNKKGNTGEKETKGNKAEILAQRDEDIFDTKFRSLLVATLDMVEAWAVKCADPNFIEQNPGGCRELGQVVLERCDRIVTMVRSSGAERS